MLVKFPRNRLMNSASLWSIFQNMTWTVRLLNLHCRHDCAQSVESTRVAPSNVFARGRDTNNATLAEDLESTRSRAVSVAALGEALGGRNIVEIARGVDNTPWVIADLVKEQEKSPVCFVIRRHNLVIPGLFASTAPARLRML